MRPFYLSLLLLLAGLAPRLSKAQTRKIFPDSLGTYWIYTSAPAAGSLGGPSVLCDFSSQYPHCYWLERDSMIGGKRYQRVAYGGTSFTGPGVTAYWVRADQANRRLYCLDSAFRERLLFDFTVTVGDSTPELYYPPDNWPVASWRLKGLVTDTMTLQPDGFRIRTWFVLTRNLDNNQGPTPYYRAMEGIGGWFTPVHLMPWQQLEQQELSCFNGRNIFSPAGGMRNSFCGCNTVTPPRIAKTRPALNSFSLTQRSYAAPIELTYAGPATRYTLYNLQGRCVEQGQTEAVFTVGMGLPSGWYVLALTVQGRVVARQRVWVLQ